MLKKATAQDADGNPIEFYYVGNLTISDIDPEDEHTVTTIDTNNESEVVEYVGPGVKK